MGTGLQFADHFSRQLADRLKQMLQRPYNTLNRLIDGGHVKATRTRAIVSLALMMLLLAAILTACAADEAVQPPAPGAAKVATAPPQGGGAVLQAGQPVPKTASSPVASIGVTVSPATKQVKVGETFAVEVQINSGSQKVDAAQASLSFDPKLLQVVDAAGAPATAIEAGSSLPTGLQNKVDNAGGTVDYAAGASFEAGKEPTGTFTVATVRFKALQAGEAKLTFSSASPRKTEAAFGGQIVELKPAGEGRYTIGQ